jgi:hypothetical protein
MKLFKHLPLMLLLAWHLPSKADSISEGQVKSAYVLNFAKFVEWPAGTAWADNKVTLCVVGNSVLGGALFALDGRKAGSRELRVVQYASENFLAGHPNADINLSACQVVFIGESEQRRVVAIIKALEDSPTLTISDIGDFAEKGGDIGLLYHENRIVFEVNLASTQKSKLRLPSQLLNLASYIFGR